MDVNPAAGLPGTDPGSDPGSEPDLVARALERLATVEGLPLEQRPDAFGEIHEHLRSALAEIDDA